MFFFLLAGVSCSLDPRHNVQMISQRASKVNISLIVNGAEGEGCVEALHKSFFKSGDLSELLIQPRLGNGSPVRTMQVEN